VEEERRLLYVGITRARRFLFLTWPSDARAGGSPFLEELGVAAPAGRTPQPRERLAMPTGDPLFDALRRWRRARAAGDGVPAYVVFHDATLAEIAARKPRTLADLRGISGIGPAKLERYGQDVLGILEGS
jgi:superfamily II DNA helicase RecQ